MPTLEVSIAGRRHQVQCDEGQEPRLRKLAGYVDDKAGDIARRSPQLTEPRILLLTSLLLADELFDAYHEVQQLRSKADRQGDAGEGETVKAVERVAERLEQLAADLEKT
jgi:cell division protein ZapA